ncbi:MAG: hypothetical protein U9R60_02635 [Bacteroidota bacterium]|nr:hypothetical protein [Bacteroidota bacterium]
MLMRLGLAIIIIDFFILTIHASDLAPVGKYIASGVVTDFVLEDNRLYAATEQGAVDIFDLLTTQRTDHLVLPAIKDFMGEDIHPRIYSVDALRQKILIACQGEGGFSNLYVHSEGSLHKIVDAEKEKMLIMKARFVDDHTVLLALLSNDYILFDLATKTRQYCKQFSTYAFSDFCLNKLKKIFLTADESGSLYLVDVRNGEVIMEYKKGNVDKVFQVDYQNDIIISGGQDRRVVIYKVGTEDYEVLQQDFLVYSVGLGPGASLGTYADSDSHNIIVFSIETMQVEYVLKGHKNPVSKICFYGEGRVLSAGTDQEILQWKIK